jgi:O-acetyl-ADP-ribose deacetylase (regulator of RNase III)
MEKKIIKVEQGDITNSGADAIVNAANNHLWMGTGVAGAIKRRGGDIIEKEAVSKGPIPVGEAVATTAGSLPHKYVIHAAAMGQDLVTDEAKIAAATKNALLLAEELNLKSIDFPALGTGVGGFPIKEAAKIMVDAAKDFLTGSKSVQRIGFVLFDDDSFKTFTAEMGAEQKEI